MNALLTSAGLRPQRRAQPARIAVVGGGLGGLAAAGHLGASGHLVTLFEQAPTLGGKAARFVGGDVTLDWGPTMLTQPSAVRDTFEALGATDLMPRLIELPHHCQYLGDDGSRFDVYADLERTVASAEALMPGEGKALRAFLAHAERIWRSAGAPYLLSPYRGAVDFLIRVTKGHPLEALSLTRLGSLARLAEEYFRTGLLRSFVDRFATYVGASPFEASAIFAMLPHLERAEGVHHVEGGLGALAAALGQALRRLGVDVRTSARVEVERTPGGFAVGGETFDAVVKNSDPLLEAARQPETLSLSGYVLLLEVDRRLSLPHHTILFARDHRAEFRALSAGELPVDETLAVCHPVATQATLAPAGRSGLFVMVNTPPLGGARGESFWQAERWALRERLLHRLREAFPELAQARVTVLGERTPVDLEALGAPSGSIYGFLPRGRWGPLRRPPQRGVEPGIFFAGGGTFPGGGVPLVLRSGAWAAGLADAWVKGARR